MACFDKKHGVRQTYWTPPDYVKMGLGRWYADICVEVDDLYAIEQAKTIVDKAMPQVYSGKNGAFYYSFVKREFLLNQLLFFWKDNGTFPEGWVCVVEQATMRPVEKDTGWWWPFPARKLSREYSRPQWIKVPSYKEASEYMAAIRLKLPPELSQVVWRTAGKDAS